MILLLGLLTEEHVGNDTDEDDCEACVEEVEVLIDRNLDDVCGQRLWDELKFYNSGHWLCPLGFWDGVSELVDFVSLASGMIVVFPYISIALWPVAV
jgi:hypothetical protein